MLRQIEYLITKMNNYDYDYELFNKLKDGGSRLRLPRHVSGSSDITSLICYEEIFLLSYLSWNRNYKFRTILVETIRHNGKNNEEHPFRVEDHLKFFLYLPNMGWYLLGHSEITDPGSGWCVLEFARTWSSMERKVRNFYSGKDISQFREIDLKPLLEATSDTISYSDFQRHYLKSVMPLRKSIREYEVIGNEVTSILLDSGERLHFN